MSETALVKRIQLEATKHGARLFRNNVGTLRDRFGAYIKYGLCVGSCDLIGWYLGRFLAVEVKTEEGKLTEDQKNFIEAVNAGGGIAFVARSVDEFIKKLEVVK